MEPPISTQGLALSKLSASFLFLLKMDDDWGYPNFRKPPDFRFPEIGLPPNHPFIDGFSLKPIHVVDLHRPCSAAASLVVTEGQATN